MAAASISACAVKTNYTCGDIANSTEKTQEANDSFYSKLNEEEPNWRNVPIFKGGGMTAETELGQAVEQRQNYRLRYGLASIGNGPAPVVCEDAKPDDNVDALLDEFLNNEVKPAIKAGKKVQ